MRKNHVLSLTPKLLTWNIHVPKTKVDKIKFEGKQLISTKTATLRHLARCIGLIISTFEAFPQANYITEN